MSRRLGLKLDYGSNPPFATIAETKGLPDDSDLAISGAAVSAVWPDAFYIQSDDRSSGIRVEKPSHGLTAGNRGYVAGAVKTNADGERYIEATTASWTTTGKTWPLGMPARSNGGGDILDSVTGFGQRGITGGSGLNNIGLLVRTWGRVASIGPDYFTIDDGSDVIVKCVVPAGVTLPAQGTDVSVTGISSCEKVQDDLHRLLLIRDQNDITEPPPPL